jgi:hypothetical protein
MIDAIDRRRFMTLTGAAALVAAGWRARARESARAGNLLAAPIELRGEWVYADAVARVLLRVREVDLSGLRLLSDRQPARISVENHNEVSPSIWLHSDEPERAAIIVDIGPSSDWCKLAYQFGHELGHVLSNSWQFSAKPQPPSQWLEECLVEAFSIRGLGLLADSWQRSPPFAGDSAFARAIRDYRSALETKYRGESGSSANLATWFHSNRAELEGGTKAPRGPAILAILSIYEEHPRPCYAEDLGGLNRWPERTAVPVERYVEQWQRSCREIGASGEMPRRLEQLFRLN